MAWGMILRSGKLPPRSGLGLPLPWTYADPEIWRSSNRRFGELLILWSLWLVLQIVLDLNMSPLGGLLAPAFLVIVFGTSNSARLYAQKYGTLRVVRIHKGRDRAIPSTGGWAIVVVREILPLAAALIPILIVRQIQPDLPDRIPVRWDPFLGFADWRLTDEALALLRQQTRFVYLMLLLAEGARLLWVWFRNQNTNIAQRMLTPRHWLYFFFKTGWVAVFGGANLGFARFAAGQGTVFPCLLPGLGILALMAILVVTEHRRTEYLPPAGS